MDKNKNRTDLLAAGRKKLNQYRQKKDGKGSSSHGKSSKKSSKSGQHASDADTLSTAAKPIEPSPVTEGEPVSHIVSDKEVVPSVTVASTENLSAPEADVTVAGFSSESLTPEIGDTDMVTEGEPTSHIVSDKEVVPLVIVASKENLLAPEADVRVAGFSPESLTPDIGDPDMVVVHEAEPQELLVAEHDVGFSTQNEGVSSQNIDVEVCRSGPSSNSDFSGSLGETKQDDVSVAALQSPVYTDAIEVAGTEVEGEHIKINEGQALFPQQDDISDVPLIQAERDQLTNVGTMQEADGSFLNRFAKNLEDTAVEETANEVEKTHIPGDLSPSAGTTCRSEGFVTSLASAESDREVNLEVRVQQEEHTPDGSSIRKRSDESGDLGVNETERVSVDPDDITITESERYSIDISSGSEGLGHEKSNKMDTMSPPAEVTLSSIGDGCSISLSQLAEMIRRLNEDEYNFLFKLIDSVPDTELESNSFLERLKEELYVTKFSRDIFCMQINEQSNLQKDIDDQCQQLVSEVSTLHASLYEANQRNGCLSEELADCRLKLEAAIDSREELQIKFLATKSQSEDFSATAHELQFSLERSQRDLSNLSAEFSESKSLLAALQAENDKLNGYITSVTVERNKLTVENDSSRRECEKLLLEQADHKLAVSTLQMENNELNLLIVSLNEEKKKLVEEKESSLLDNEKLLSELSGCRSYMTDQEREIAKLTETVALMTEDKEKLKEEKERVTSETKRLCMELDDFKSLVAAIQAENTNLSGELSSVTDESKKLQEEKQSLVFENDRLSSELIILQQRFSTEHGEHTRLEVELQEVMTRIGELTEENLFLSKSLDIHKANMGEIDSRGTIVSVGAEIPKEHARSFQVRISGHENGADDLHSCQAVVQQDDETGGGPSLDPHKETIFDDYLGFVDLKEHLEGAEKVLENLDKAIEMIYSHSEALSRSNGKEAAPAVSKLIQAFESKVQSEESEIEEKALTEDQSLKDPFVYTKKQTRNMRTVLEQLSLAAENASDLFKRIRDDGRMTWTTLGELKVHHETLKEHTDLSEASNIELGILYEAAKQHLYLVEEKNIELEVLCDSLKLQESRLRAKTAKLGDKLNVYQSRISELQKQLDSLQQGSEETALVMHDQLECLQKEESEKALMFEQQWNAYIAQIVETVGRLDRSANIVTPNHNDLDINYRIAASVDAATETIKDLQERLEASLEDLKAASNKYGKLEEKFSDLVEKNELGIHILHKVHVGLKKLLTDCGVQSAIQTEEPLDPFDYSSYNSLMELLENYLGERLQLQILNDNLNSELVRIKGIEELNRHGLGFLAIQELIEKVESVVKLECSETNGNERLGSHLESLVALLIQKCIEADEQLSLCKEELRFKENELTEHQENVLKHENEILLLRESLRQAEEGFTVVNAKLQEKVRELEQSEQRVTSIREKLGIAVSKGKGLVVQRDGLKQSLAEKSHELERCLLELKLKDASLQEEETKLKTYSEASERVEALESELSYIRNTATALRESFLLKDSVLQRIEEILEDLDLPEHFHSGDIIEKIDWLARSFTGNSLPRADWDQKSSVGGSYSDTGFVIMDAWKEDGQPSSNSGDELRIRYEELQGKFYGLAEQNEMLEQSLMERNHVVQRWEELLDMINMPLQLRSMDAEHKIEWLGNALSEADHDKSSLQHKIDSLENYCRSLTSELEISESKISDVEADIQSIALDRENLSTKLEVLSTDRDNLSTRALQFELENEKLQKEVNDMQEKLEISESKISDVEADIQSIALDRANLSTKLEILSTDRDNLSTRALQFELENEKLQKEVNDMQEKLLESLKRDECLQSIEGEIVKLQSLVSCALQDAGISDFASTGTSTECLEGLLRKLIENYKTILSLRSESENAEDGNSTEALLAHPDDATNRDVLVTEEPAIVMCTQVADENTRESTCIDSFVTDEPDKASLRKHLEEALSDLKVVKEERDRYMEKQQSLMSDVETLNKKGEELQELLTQEEQKSASVREKLNVAVRKGKSLLQQRDNQKQTIEEIRAELEHLKVEINHKESALIENEQKIRELSSSSERIEVLESERLFLRNRREEMEHCLQDREQTLNMIFKTLGDIDVGGIGNVSNPVEKLQEMGKLFNDLQAAVASSKQESAKSRRAAELLLAELNEVQERNDGLQDDLTKLSSEFAELSKQKDAAELSRLEALSRVEELSRLHSEEKRKQYSDFILLKSSVDQLRNSFCEVDNLLADVFSKELKFIQNMEANAELFLNQSDVTDLADMPLFSASFGFTSGNSVDKENLMSVDPWSEDSLRESLDDNGMIKICNSLGQNLHDIADYVGAFKEKVHNHTVSLHEHFKSLCKVIDGFPREMTFQKESVGKEKDMEIAVLQENIALLYKVCANSIWELRNKSTELSQNIAQSGENFSDALFVDDEIPVVGVKCFSSNELIKSVADRLLSTVKQFSSLNTDVIDGNQKEMKITIENLQQELQEKDIKNDKICSELVRQIKQAEATSRSFSEDAQSSNARIHDLEERFKRMEGERNSLEQRVKELQDELASFKQLQERVSSLTDVLASKDQEIEALMQALDEEEVQMENLNNKIASLEDVVLQKNLDLENLEISRAKVAKKLSVTVNRFDELHNLSENLLAEIEKLQMQLQDRDADISFLRQEVTRCTNEVLAASQMSNKRDSDEFREFLSWLDTIASQAGMQDVHDDARSIQVHEYKEVIQKKIASFVSELEDLRGVTQSSHSLLEAERKKVEELIQREENLGRLLRERDSRLNMLEVVGDMDRASDLTSEIVEVEPLINKRTVSGNSGPSTVRSLRKVNNDQVAIAIDANPGDNDNSSNLDDDDDKAHGFKSLTTSRIIPRFTRPVTNMIDGLWVTCDRTLMRQPILRLGIILYWAVIHALLAAYAV